MTRSVIRALIPLALLLGILWAGVLVLWLNGDSGAGSAVIGSLVGTALIGAGICAAVRLADLVEPRADNATGTRAMTVRAEALGVAWDEGYQRGLRDADLQHHADNPYRSEITDEREPGEAFCSDCPDHEACLQAAPCSLVKRVDREWRTP